MIANKIKTKSYIDLKTINSLSNRIIGKYNLYNKKGFWINNEILNNIAIVDKVEQSNSSYMYINDGSYVTTNRMKSTIINYPQGFLDNGEFILITAGGME